MMKLTDNEIRDITRYLEEGKPLPEKYRFLFFDEKREIVRVRNEESGETEEVWTGDFVFEIEYIL